MWRPAFLLVLAVALQGAKALQVESHGVPASVLSPTSPGTAHGVPSSVNSPTPLTPASGRAAVNSRRFHVLFGNPHARRPRRQFVPVPIFIPAYPLASDYVDSEQAAAQDMPEDPQASAQDADALRDAYNRGARDALLQQRESRYGEHYLDAREQNQSKTSAGKPSEESESADSAGEEPDNSPATVFIFKDGHKIETRNYAISGETLFDFSNNAMRKISLGDLDVDATKKANDSLGITAKLPSTL